MIRKLTLPFLVGLIAITALPANSKTNNPPDRNTETHKSNISRLKEERTQVEDDIELGGKALVKLQKKIDEKEAIKSDMLKLLNAAIKEAETNPSPESDSKIKSSRLKFQLAEWKWSNLNGKALELQKNLNNYDKKLETIDLTIENYNAKIASIEMKQRMEEAADNAVKEYIKGNAENVESQELASTSPSLLVNKSVADQKYLTLNELVKDNNEIFFNIRFSKKLYIKSEETGDETSLPLKYMGVNHYQSEVPVSEGEYIFRLKNTTWKQYIPKQHDGLTYIVVLDNRKNRQPQLTLFNKDDVASSYKMIKELANLKKERRSRDREVIPVYIGNPYRDSYRYNQRDLTRQVQQVQEQPNPQQPPPQQPPPMTMPPQQDRPPMPPPPIPRVPQGDDDDDDIGDD